MVPGLTLHGMWPSFSTPVAPTTAVADPLAEDTATFAHHRRALRDISLITRPSDGAVTTKGSCFWPQDCTQPSWWPEKSPWKYDSSLLPTGPEYENLAPAWYTDGLGSHEWPKHGTCAAWADAAGTNRGLDQAGYYATMFDLAQKEGTPDALIKAMGGSIPLAELQVWCNCVKLCSKMKFPRRAKKGWDV